VAVVFIDRVEFDNCTLSGKAKQVLLDWAVTYQPQLLAALEHGVCRGYAGSN
jgi:hypothetical protein